MQTKKKKKKCPVAFLIVFNADNSYAYPHEHLRSGNNVKLCSMCA